MENAGLAAMARHDFLGVDMAIACQFSLQNLRPEYRPKDTGRHGRQGVEPIPSGMDTTMIDDLSLVLDDGELISVADIDVARPVTLPEPADEISLSSQGLASDPAGDLQAFRHRTCGACLGRASR